MSAPSVLQRVIFPVEADPDALSLYLDPDDWSSNLLGESDEMQLARARGVLAESADRHPQRLTERNALTWVRGRRQLAVPAGGRASLGTYFNAFPTSYWRRWTNLSSVVLEVSASGHGQVIVYRSNARGVIQRVEAKAIDGEGRVSFVLDFASFLDGGWYWFDLIAGAEPLTLLQADWCAPDGATPPRERRATVCITTLNRTSYCTELLQTIASDDEALAALDAVLVVDQGSERIVEADGYEPAREALGGRLRVIEQANLGGSGGFARGMLETLDAGESGYALLLDDDVALEPESIRRAVVFGNHCVTPTIVGGHMFDMYDKSKLHAFAEGVRTLPFVWGPLTPARHDFADSNLRQTLWMHRRFDVDYNGWWMSLIPVEVLEAVGLALPVFIKWDDAEYSLRARDHGFPTVSLPGAAVWHVSWVDKDDSHDWQAFFHARNRLIVALLHSPHAKGGRLSQANLSYDVKNLLAMDYYTVAMRHAAIESVLAGPEGLHEDLPGRLSRVRALSEGFTESRALDRYSDLPLFPALEIQGLGGSRVETGPRGVGLVVWLARQALRHGWTRVPAGARRAPQAHLAFQDARWFTVPEYDSVLVSNAQGSGASWHVRRPRLFRSMLFRAVRLNRRYRRRWSELRSRYRAALADITSPERWRETFDRTR